MSKNAIIFHGTGGNPDVCWYKWLCSQLERRNYTVSIPHYPTLNKEPIETFLPKILSNHSFDQNSVLVGHSGGAALLLSILEHIDVKVQQAILVAGYATSPEGHYEPVLQDSFDWDLIKTHVKELYFINSVTDPYGCDDSQGRLMFDHLGGTQIICNEGHFGDHDQLYPTMELVDKLIE